MKLEIGDCIMFTTSPSNAHDTGEGSRDLFLGPHIRITLSKEQIAQLRGAVNTVLPREVCELSHFSLHEELRNLRAANAELSTTIKSIRGVLNED